MGNRSRRKQKYFESLDDLIDQLRKPTSDFERASLYRLDPGVENERESMEDKFVFLSITIR